MQTHLEILQNSEKKRKRLGFSDKNKKRKKNEQHRRVGSYSGPKRRLIVKGPETEHNTK